jgi:hypothetical protein
MELPLYKRLYMLPKTDKYIVVPQGYEMALRREACMETRRAVVDTLFAREVVWVETLGL